MPASTRVIPITPVAVEPARRIHARRTQGVFTRWRLALVLVTQLVFYGMPWLSMDGRQAVWFDLAHQRFYLFGALLLPQDLIYLTGLLIVCAMLLFLVTVVAGRVWCGFACPQTVYTEMFMAIERWLEGDRSRRTRLDQAAWGPAKLLRRGGKHLAWALLALWTGLSFVGWFTPIRELVHDLPTLGTGFWNTFWMLFYAGITYLHAGLLRERICQHACPYGRFQSAMLDRSTLVVSYDQARGEPRGRHSQTPAEARGDCVDCTLCVQVCPTGIDIRQGLQSACISCGVCIDACNQVMDKLQAPRGLIRFSPLDNQAQWHTPPWRRPRVAIYGGIILAVLVAMAAGLSQRPQLRLDVQRDRGVMARMAANGDIENLYRLQVRSATLQPQRLRIEVNARDPAIAAPLTAAHEPQAPLLPSAGALSLPVTVRLPAQAAQALRGQTVPVRFTVTGEGGTREVLADSTFSVPR